MKAGDKVVCVIDGGWFSEDDEVINPPPIKDRIYTVVANSIHKGALFIALKEKPIRDKNGFLEYFQAEGFRKIEPVKIAHDITAKLAKRALKESTLIERLDIVKKKVELA